MGTLWDSFSRPLLREQNSGLSFQVKNYLVEWYVIYKWRVKKKIYRELAGHCVYRKFGGTKVYRDVRHTQSLRSQRRPSLVAFN